MPKLRTLTSEDVIRILPPFGFEIASQRGSHAKLKRILPDGTKEILTILRHKDLDKGTFRAMLRQALRYIPEEQLRPLFYAD
jgi:predicted RNA binding protein YcfA (HicA-like mRNA interferase family)